MSLRALLLAAVASNAIGDPSQDARVRALEMEIRCVQCENEPISQSTADIAGDMRALVRERVAAGDTDAEIRAFFRERYGDFVLFRPPWDARTWALWMAPGLLFALGVWAIRRGATSGGEALAPEEGER